MEKTMLDPNIRSEEKRTLKWFLTLFYIIYIAFDAVYYIISKYIPVLKNNYFDKIGPYIYIVMFSLIPIAYYLIKKQKLYMVKYVYFITYTSLTCLNDIISFWGEPEKYQSGNAVEIFLLLFSPIFVSSPFVKVVAVGTILKYIIIGVLIKAPIVLLCIVLVIILSLFSFILLFRFKSYVKAIKNSYDQQLEGVVKGVIATLELKDPYTKGHSERVAKYALELAKVTGKFSKEELRDFKYACLLHDIGKIHIPDHILMKPSGLTKEEYEIIKSHTTVGAEAVSKIVGFNNTIEVVRSHHERWDGKGYPDQLKGEGIPYLARVAAIADAFDAMTSTRSYRSALSVEEAYKRILDGKETQFDPELVNLFKNVYPLWINIQKGETFTNKDLFKFSLNEAYN